MCLAMFADGFVWDYEYLYLRVPVQQARLPIPFSVYADTIPILTVFMGFGFFLQFWRFVRMLPPKAWMEAEEA